MEYESKSLDHLGIVAGVCKEIGLTESVNSIVGVNSQQKVSTGDAVTAMVINALGFAGKPLYMYPEYMAQKPVKLLFENGLEPDDFNDDTIGRALDRIYENNPTNIFMKVSFEALRKNGVDRNFFHLDTTSISVQGQYENSEDDEIPIKITYGHSKDSNPDLKQYMISLITVSKSSIPAWICALSGNTSDKTHFREVVDEYSKMLAGCDENPYFIMDSAMYTEKNVRDMSPRIKWISRAPENITMVSDLEIGTDIKDMEKCYQEGYLLKSFTKTYADVKQKWVVVFSEKNYAKEIKTLDKNVIKEKAKVEKKLWHFGNEEYTCEEDAFKAMFKIEKKWNYHKLDDCCIIVKKKTGKRGRPKKNSNVIKHIFQIQATFQEDEEAIENKRKQKGKYIVATNAQNLDNETIYREYKEQQGVERGFRFIKDPRFFAESTFLKKEQRIVSMVMIMGISLLVYALAERKLRKALKDMNETLPNQLGKPIKNPTMRMVFEKFSNVTLLIINDDGK
ncbi:MAG: IS1634 family transposase, partial [Candidatus Aenigmatarchaeota archaeon]